MTTIPDVDIPESITPGYQPVEKERVRLDEDEREAFLHDVSYNLSLLMDHGGRRFSNPMAEELQLIVLVQLVCFHPRHVCDTFTENILCTPTMVTDAIHVWADKKYKKKEGEDRAKLEREMNSVGLALVVRCNSTSAALISN